MGMIASFALCIALGTAYRFDPAYTEINLNQNQTAAHSLDFWGEWTGHNYTASPDNWRFPFYTLFLDRFVNGDPYNDDINGTAFERVTDSNQMRHGGDLQGLVDTLDYIQVSSEDCPTSSPEMHRVHIIVYFWTSADIFFVGHGHQGQ